MTRQTQAINIATACVERKTRLGTIRGVERLGAQTFWGVRYGKAKRFQRPVRTNAWTGVYDATQPKAQALQGPYNPIYGPQPGGGYDEDCLFLNIHIPGAASDEKRPVLFWVHGGAWIEGSANQYDGSALAVEADAVVVCINYRLGVLGTLNLDERGGPYVDSANCWLADQILALEWVRDHIADYGGDARCVTVFGESAGGGSTLALATVPAARGLAQRAMAFSSPFFSRSLPIADLPSRFAKIRKTSRAQAIDWLISAPAEEIVALQVKHNLHVGVAAAGELFPRGVAEMMAERGADMIPLVIGYQPHEGQFYTEYFRARGMNWLKLDLVQRVIAGGLSALVASGTKAARSYRKRLGKLVPMRTGAQQGDATWTDFMRRSSVMHALAATQAGSRGYRYILDVPCRMGGRDLGSTHMADIAFTFNWYADPSPTLNPLCVHPDAPALAKRWVAMIAKFARTGDPSGPLGDWPAYDAAKRQTLIVSLSDARVESDPDRDFRLSVWQEPA